ncbi:uncharacterized protein BDV17DRAFT_111057 [Aspergillus undulatus]|uniref:uncharacterized protein n=1 Tax=Aspergillus undulatus TaxID=1810928 RepID=UPI003CCCF551
MTLNGSRTNPFAIVSPSTTLSSTIDRLASSTERVIASSHSPEPAQRLDLPSDFTPVVEVVIEEAKRLYQEAKNLSEAPRVSSHLAVLQKSLSVGRVHDALVVPLENKRKTNIIVRDESGRVEVGWVWTNCLFTDHLTYLDIAEGERVGAVIVHFPRQQ